MAGKDESSVEPKSPLKNSKKTNGNDDFQPYFNLMLSQNLSELEIRDQDFYLRLSRTRPPASLPVAYYPPGPSGSAPAAPVPAAESVPPAQNQFHSVASPLAGVFYRSPSPQSEPFVKEGAKVSLGQVLCIVEAMKVMNEIRADRPCVIQKILAENGKPVAAGQNLFLVDPIA